MKKSRLIVRAEKESVEKSMKEKYKETNDLAVELAYSDIESKLSKEERDNVWFVIDGLGDVIQKWINNRSEFRVWSAKDIEDKLDYYLKRMKVIKNKYTNISAMNYKKKILSQLIELTVLVQESPVL